MDSFTLPEVEKYYESEMQNPGKPEIDPLAGIIFHPTDEEIMTILNYKKSGSAVHSPISMRNIYQHEPSQIPGLGAIQTGGKWWNFFCALEALDDSGKRFRRSTSTGYWKATGETVEIKAKRTNEVIGEKRTLVFHERHRGGAKGRCKEVRTNWVMHEYSAYADNNPLFQDLVICRIKFKKDKKRRISSKNEKNENKRAKKRPVSTNEEGQPSYHVAADDRNHVAEKSSPELRLQPRCPMISTSISHDVAETLPSQPQLLPSCNLFSNSGVENAYPSVSNTSDHALEDTSQVDPYPSIPDSNNHDIEDTSQVEHLPLENPNALNGSRGHGSRGLDQTSISTLQLPNLQEQGCLYYNVSSNENNGWNSLVSEWDCLPQFASPSPYEFDLQFLGEETGHSTYSSFVTPTH